ncbi:MAG: helix-turn-helix domain-containing protein [Lentisphaeria bacterium]|nr:helix-turn-helix domain-containing protein [Lentisphaeria bacterium]
MKEATITAIEMLAKSDPEATPELVRAIVRTCKTPTLGKRQMIPAKEAMAILGISRPTLRGLAKSGKLHQVKATPRKTRFFLDEVEALAAAPAV